MMCFVDAVGGGQLTNDLSDFFCSSCRALIAFVWPQASHQCCKLNGSLTVTCLLCPQPCFIKHTWQVAQPALTPPAVHPALALVG
jgi:hypothetical protein